MGGFRGKKGNRENGIIILHIFVIYIVHNLYIIHICYIYITIYPDHDYSSPNCSLILLTYLPTQLYTLFSLSLNKQTKNKNKIKKNFKKSQEACIHTKHIKTKIRHHNVDEKRPTWPKRLKQVNMKQNVYKNCFVLIIYWSAWCLPLNVIYIFSERNLLLIWWKLILILQGDAICRFLLGKCSFILHLCSPGTLSVLELNLYFNLK